MYTVVHICPSSNLAKRWGLAWHSHANSQFNTENPVSLTRHFISMPLAMPKNVDKTARTLHSTGLTHNQSEKQSMGCRQHDNRSRIA